MEPENRPTADEIPCEFKAANLEIAPERKPITIILYDDGIEPREEDDAVQAQSKHVIDALFGRK
jgi:hypothetical protein